MVDDQRVSLTEIFGHLAPFLLHVLEERGDRVVFSFRFSREYNLGAVKRDGDCYDLVLMKQRSGRVVRQASFSNLSHEQLVETFETKTGVICR